MKRITLTIFPAIFAVLAFSQEVKFPHQDEYIFKVQPLDVFGEPIMDCHCVIYAQHDTTTFVAAPLHCFTLYQPIEYVKFTPVGSGKSFTRKIIDHEARSDWDMIILKVGKIKTEDLCSNGLVAEATQWTPATVLSPFNQRGVIAKQGMMVKSCDVFYPTFYCIESGDSGSPVVDEEGRVLALVIGFLNNGHTVTTVPIINFESLYSLALDPKRKRGTQDPLSLMLIK